MVVVDESSTRLDMQSRYARVERGKRAFAQHPRNYGKNMTLLAALRLDGMSAAIVVEGAVTTAVFEVYLREVLLPTLHRGDIIILDNLAAHKSKIVRALVHRHGCPLLFLPAYSPDFSPIENAFAKIKQFLRRARAQTVDTLITALRHALDTITPIDAIGFFAHAGFPELD